MLLKNLLGGAHRDIEIQAQHIKAAFENELAELSKLNKTISRRPI